LADHTVVEKSHLLENQRKKSRSEATTYSSLKDRDNMFKTSTGFLGHFARL
jgi:hypothetical protein